MAWQPNIPNATDALAQSQSDIKGNFQALDPIVTQFQNYVLLGQQSGNPATSATQMALYVKSGIDSNPQMFIERQSGSVDTPTVIEFTSSAKATSGWTRLPSGILMKWGRQNSIGAGATVTVSWPTGATIPVFSASPYNIQVTSISASGTNSVLLVSVISATQFSVFNPSSSSRDIFYFGIGS